MRRRYDLRRSDNYPYTGKLTHICSGNGSVFVYIGFPVTSASISWVAYPFAQDDEMSSSSNSSSTNSSSLNSLSSSSSSSISSVSSSSSSSKDSHSTSSFSLSKSSSSSSSSSSLDSSSSSSMDSSSSSSDTTESSESSESSSTMDMPSDLPRIYVVSCSATGFTVNYRNIPARIGAIEFSFVVV